MTTAHFDEQLRRLVRRQPFTPFTVELRDGSRLVIDQPEALGFQTGAAAFIAADGIVRFFNSQQVQRIAADRNGHGKEPPAG